MFQVRRILCPVDFSDSSRHALEHAAVIAGWYGAELTALHVCPQAFLAASVLSPAEFDRAGLPTAFDRRQLEESLLNWLEPAAVRGVRSKVDVADGTAVDVILQRAAALQADMLVLGTHGRGGFERLVLGSVAEKVLRKASCPVLTVPPPAQATSQLPFKQLLCPVDFSPPSVSALQVALSLAQESGARLTLLHVVEWPANYELIVDQAFDVGQFRTDAEINALKQLRALVPSAVRDWCEPVVRVAFGRPYEKVIAEADTCGADVIVMGVHGRSTLDVLLFGSTTNQVVRHATCPVLTLRQ